MLVEEHGRVISTYIGQGHIMVLTYGDGHKLIIDERCSEVPVSVNIFKSAQGNYAIDIDSDKNTTTATFKVTKDDQGTTLFTVNEDGSISFSNGAQLSSAGVLSGVTVADPTADQQIASKKYSDDAFAPIAKGVTSGDSHDHVGGDGSVIERITEKGLGAAALQCKVIEIGDWDMNADSGHTVAHGLGANYKNIRSVYVTIRRDDDAAPYYNLMAIRDLADASLISGGVYSYDGTNIQLYRRTGGNFDGVLFDDFGGTQGNRGWVAIWYEV